MIQQDQVQQEGPRDVIQQAQVAMQGVEEVAQEVEDELQPPGPPSYPREEAYLYEEGVQQPAFNMSDEQYRQMIPHVSSLPVDMQRIAGFPGLDQENAQRLQGETQENREQLVRATQVADTRIQLLMQGKPELMRPVTGFELANGTQVMLGTPIDFGRGGRSGGSGYVGIPMYIREQGSEDTQFVMAYRSRSQACWRRHGGSDYRTGDTVGDVTMIRPHYYKGGRQGRGGEHWQNFDHRIQRRLDEHLTNTAAVRTVATLHSFGVQGMSGLNDSLLRTNEQAVQHSMGNGARTLDLSEPENAPAVTGVVSHWGATGNPVYQNQLNATVESENGEFRYGISMTRYGVFVQYVEDNAQRDINSVGAPSRAVRLDRQDSWLTAPVVEYNNHQRNITRRDGSTVDYEQRDELPRNRVLFTNLHTTENSPIRAFSRANRRLDGVYAALDAGNLQLAEERFNQWLEREPDQRVQY
jgi:hypothetical protein